MNEMTLYKYLARVSYLKAILIKLALSFLVPFLLRPDSSHDSFPFLAIALGLYFLFSIYHISLRLSGNYIIAAALSLVFLMLLVYLNDLSSLGKISNNQHDLIAVLILLAPFLYDSYVFVYVLFIKLKSLRQQN